MNALKIYIWFIFSDGNKKEWFDLFLPIDVLDSESIDPIEDLESYIMDNDIVFDFNDYSKFRSHGAFDWRIESYEEVEHNFDLPNYDIVPTDSPKERKKELKRIETFKDLDNYEIDESKIEFTGNGVISYKDKLFGSVELNLHDLKDFLNNPKYINASILNENGDKVIEIKSDKNEHTGKMLRLKGHADYQFYWDGLPEKTNWLSEGDVAIYNKPGEDRFDLISDEKWVMFNRQNFFKQLIKIKESGKQLDMVKMIESGIKQTKKES
jgi:hypothetical protein